MKLMIKVKPNSKEAKVEKTAEGQFVIRVKSPAREGKANKETIALLGDYFGVPKARIAVISGHAGKNKVVEIV